MEQSVGYINTPIGILKISGDGDSISEIVFLEENTMGNENLSDVVHQCKLELNEYFSGERKEFSVKIKMNGTVFQKYTWKEVLQIPYGKVDTYASVAIKVGNKNAVRAVGNANKNNKLPILIPCHRVIGVGGKLTGYAGGIWRKRWLLDHENPKPSNQTKLF